jgi:uncharacterized protein
MPEYLSPGVYIEEVNTGPRPIEGVGTAMAAFIGFAPNGKLNQPVLVTSWTHYVKEFGLEEAGGRRNPYMPNAFLSHAVYGYFQNGGGRCYVVRVPVPADGSARSAPQAEPLAIPSRGTRAEASLLIAPKAPPAEAIQVEIAAPTGDAPPEGTFTLHVRMGDLHEEYTNVSLGRGSGVKNVAEAVGASALVTIVRALDSGLVADRAPRIGSYTIAPPLPALPMSSASADVRFEGDVVARSGVAGLEIADEVTMICCPDLMSAYPQNDERSRTRVRAVHTAMIAHCENTKDRMAILDTPPYVETAQQALEWRAETNYDSAFAALYFPWIEIDDPNPQPGANGSAPKLKVPPCGHMAGIWARNDTERGVHKAPANEVIRGALGATIAITKGEQDLLNPKGINCLRSFAGRGLRVWGARTLASDPAWRYVSVRRLFNYVEKSIELGTQWVVFEPNDPDLWDRVKRDVDAFLTGVWRSGALFGTTAGEAFFTKCDAEVNPPEQRDLGQLVVVVGMAPVKPAEFVIFRFSQWAGGGA